MQIINRSGIYEIVNTVNGKRYIGSAKRMRYRLKDHRKHLRRQDHDNQKLQRAWNKYGAEVFRYRPLLVCSPENLLFYEQLCIDNLLPEYNICRIAKSSLGTKRTPEHCAAQSARMKGKRMSVEARARMSASRIGKKHSEETKRKMAIAATGRKLSEEIRQKVGAAHRGRKLTPEHYAALSAGRRAYWDQKITARSMSKTPDWATGLPLIGEGKIGQTLKEAS